MARREEKAVSSSKRNGIGVRESAGQGREVTKPAPDFEELRTPHEYRENTDGASAQAGAWTHSHWQGTEPCQKHGDPGVAARGGRSAVCDSPRAGGGGRAWAQGPEAEPAEASAQAALTLPSLGADWEWHTFRTDGNTLIDPRDMIRLRVAAE